MPAPAVRKIIIDTDPGQDDAVAILLALASPEIEVLGIAAVAGNVPLALTQANARKVCELAGRPDVKVHAGAVRPPAAVQQHPPLAAQGGMDIGAAEMRPYDAVWRCGIADADMGNLSGRQGVTVLRAHDELACFFSDDVCFG